jgi:phosphoribosylformylglycinamidine cyclo-ligase
VDDAEMRRTFNMGIGFVIVVAREDAAAATRTLEAQGERVYAIGEVVPGAPGVEYV